MADKFQRSNQYIAGAMGAVTFVLDFCLLEETYEQTLLRKRAAEIRRNSRNFAIHHTSEDEIAKRLKPQVRITAKAEEGNKPSHEFSIPGGVFISQGHCWASLGQDGSLRVGMDNFAKKLIGPVDSIEMPSKELPVRAGQTLFTVRQGSRHIHFVAPVSGRVTQVNAALAMDSNSLASSSYQNQWICVLADDDLDRELPKLKIGKTAVALFQEDIARFTAFMKSTNQQAKTADTEDFALCLGAMETLTDEQWNQVAKEFFGNTH